MLNYSVAELRKKKNKVVKVKKTKEEVIAAF